MKGELIFEEMAFDAGGRMVRTGTLALGAGLYLLEGANGAGKSTLFDCMFGLRRSMSGAVSLDGINSISKRRQFLSMASYMPQSFPCYGHMTGSELLVHFLRLRGIGRHDAEQSAQFWLARVGLMGDAYRRCEQYSVGMLQRLGFAYALQAPTRACILDEPTAGVDAVSRQTMYSILVAEAAERIIVFTDHDFPSSCAARLSARLRLEGDRLVIQGI
ncbi:ABC transporter ATP-binding protein [Stenotrophomonas sp. ZAC14D2_NAIMI4_6]|uniref:ATP-binding cassette domain-containing protein n=1 Tax=Stenotrophomonas sp. ZAC14D2_NAIMI4_6 TaxID=2072406 RepID=UPI00131F3E7F|nr:ABC transporter ATP-binding protein [Stenotrophomonas sp. ZAC14D2_NAIMI4_6]